MRNEPGSNRSATHLLRSCVLILVLASVVTSNAQQPKRDGNWWRPLPSAVKMAYLLGYFDGGVEVALRKNTGNPFSSDNLLEQFVRDLDSFYENPQNRRFSVAGTLWNMDKLKARR